MTWSLKYFFVPISRAADTGILWPAKNCVNVNEPCLHHRYILTWSLLIRLFVLSFVFDRGKVGRTLIRSLSQRPISQSSSDCRSIWQPSRRSYFRDAVEFAGEFRPDSSQFRPLAEGRLPSTGKTLSIWSPN